MYLLSYFVRLNGFINEITEKEKSITSFINVCNEYMRPYKKIYYNSLKKGDSIYISKGLAHGYRCIGKENILLYFLSKTYNPKKNRGIKWDDKILNIFWGIKKPILSIKDRNLPTLLSNKK